MAAWRRKGGLEKFEQRLVEGMGARGYAEAFARQIYQQILGFGEYGFPESHSASFALLVYVSAWLKHYEPAAFCGALLNSQPMGFYAPAQLVQDARRHDVEVLSADVTVSAWDCTLERAALRLGLRMVGGLSEASAQRIVAARRVTPFAHVADLAHRAQLNRHDLGVLAAAGALAALAGHRHAAAWDVAGVEKLPPLLAGATFDEAPAALAAPTEGQDIVADYNALGLTLGRHPLALLRGQLRARRLLTSAEVRDTPHGRIVRTAGIVIGGSGPTRQAVSFSSRSRTRPARPTSSCGATFRSPAPGAARRPADGRVRPRRARRASWSTFAGRLVDLSPLLGSLPTHSRDFH
jgi:error-prone DNA polymerase